MLIPELFNETNECANVGAESDGRRTRLLQVTPVNLLTHIVVAPGISGMCQGPAPILTSPCPFYPISSTRLPQLLADIRHRELLRDVGVGKDSNIFDSQQLLIEVVITISACGLVKVLNVGSVGSGNS